MIRKLKHIINKENQQSPNSATPQSPHDQQPSEMLRSLHPETPVNYIKRKFKSTKSWAKLGKYPKLFKENEEEEEDPTYESMPNLEVVHHEFESYLSKMFQQQRETTRAVASSQSTDYGFESSCDLTSLSSTAIRRNSSLKHSTLNPRDDESLISNTENQLYFRILQRLANTSLAKPENVPLMCIKAFRPHDYEWAQLVARLGMTNRDDIQLIELSQGLPVNAMHYLPCLDLVYVKTADDLIGYLPRTHCKALASTRTQAGKDDVFTAPRVLRSLSQNNNSNNNSTRQNHRLTFNVPPSAYEVDKKELVEYHSLSSFEFCAESATGGGKQPGFFADNDKLFKPINEDQSIADENDTHMASQRTYLPKMGDSSSPDESFAYEPRNGRPSDVPPAKPPRESAALMDNQSAVNFKLANDDYEDCNDLVLDEALSPKQFERCLSSLQSRSRLPISVRSNLNLTLMDNKHKGLVQSTVDRLKEDAANRSTPSTHNESYLNLMSSQVLKTNEDKSSAKKTGFEREKYVRRSLDSSLMNGKLFAIPIDFEDDMNKTEQQAKGVAEQQAVSKFRFNFMKQLDHFKQKNGIKFDSTESIALESNEDKKPSLPYPDLDIGKIELDSIKDTSIAQYMRETGGQDCPTPERPPRVADGSVGRSDRLWTIVAHYTAQNPREMSVWPGFQVNVIKENAEWLYVKLVKSDRTSTQQYGFVPRSCAVSFQELISRSKTVEKKDLRAPGSCRKSLVTAL